MLEYVTDWTPYAPYFTEEEFKCKHTGKCFMRKSYMDLLLKLRKAYGKAMVPTSGYRDKTHPAEQGKSVSGEHTLGNCCDIAIEKADAYQLLKLAFQFGFTRIGIHQKGNERFLHLGLGGSAELPSPTIWSY